MEITEIFSEAFLKEGLIPIDAKLFEAVSQNNLEKVKELLSSGADPNASNHDNWTFLITAAQHDFVEIAEMLIANGAKINARHRPGVDNQSALMFAAMNNSLRTAKLLIEKGANVDARCGGGRTPISQAARRGFTEMVKLLLDHGANSYAKDRDERDALLLAVIHGHAETADLIADKRKAQIEALDLQKTTLPDTQAHVPESDNKANLNSKSHGD